MHAHMACIRPWPCTYAVVRLLNAHHLNLNPFLRARIRLRPNGDQHKKLCRTRDLRRGSEANNVTDTTVSLYHITSVISPWGRVCTIPDKLNYSSAALLEWWSMWW